eukprot:1141714-Pelagomonas_calceolata.AAC.2
MGVCAWDGVHTDSYLPGVARMESSVPVFALGAQRLPGGLCRRSMHRGSTQRAWLDKHVVTTHTKKPTGTPAWLQLVALLLGTGVYAGGRLTPSFRTTSECMACGTVEHGVSKTSLGSAGFAAAAFALILIGGMHLDSVSPGVHGMYTSSLLCKL